jgi:hypothetical protein
VPDATTLDLTTAMTLEAWVNPTQDGPVWRQAILKESRNGLAYGLYAFDDHARPSGFINASGIDIGFGGPSSLPRSTWSHLATTFDGSTQRLYVNGVLTAQRAASGPITTSNMPLKIGGNAVWGEWFKGLIDDVRVWDRALSASELKAAMETAA